MALFSLIHLELELELELGLVKHLLEALDRLHRLWGWVIQVRCSLSPLLVLVLVRRLNHPIQLVLEPKANSHLLDKRHTSPSPTPNRSINTKSNLIPSPHHNVICSSSLKQYRLSNSSSSCNKPEPAPTPSLPTPPIDHTTLNPRLPSGPSRSNRSRRMRIRCMAHWGARGGRSRGA